MVYERVTVPNSLTMNVYAISIFGTSVTLPIMLIIFKYSDKFQVIFMVFALVVALWTFQSYHPTVTKVRILLAITLLHLLVDIPALICEYFYIDKVIIKSRTPVANLQTQPQNHKMLSKHRNKLFLVYNKRTRNFCSNEIDITCGRESFCDNFNRDGRIPISNFTKSGFSRTCHDYEICFTWHFTLSR